MTRAEFYEKYKDVELSFSSYFKYTFTYKAELDDGLIVMARVGGDHDTIYRMNVSHEDKGTMYTLDPYAGEVYHKDNPNKIIDEFYDY